MTFQMWAEQESQEWACQVGQRKSQGASVLHKEPQATEYRWQQKKWPSPGMVIALVAQHKWQTLKKYIEVALSDSAAYLGKYMSIPAQKLMKQDLLKNETKNLQENQKRCMEVFGGGKGKDIFLFKLNLKIEANENKCRLGLCKKNN